MEIGDSLRSRPKPHNFRPDERRRNRRWDVGRYGSRQQRVDFTTATIHRGPAVYHPRCQALRNILWTAEFIPTSRETTLATDSPTAKPSCILSRIFGPYPPGT